MTPQSSVSHALVCFHWRIIGLCGLRHFGGSHPSRFFLNSLLPEHVSREWLTDALNTSSCLSSPFLLKRLDFWCDWFDLDRRRTWRVFCSLSFPFNDHSELGVLEPVGAKTNFSLVELMQLCNTSGSLCRCLLKRRLLLVLTGSRRKSRVRRQIQGII